MEGHVLSGAARRVAGAARRRGLRVARRAYDAADRLAFPEAATAAEHWQRAAMIESVDQHIAALGPEGLRAAEISGDSHAAKPWKDYTGLMYPEYDICAPVADDEVGRYDVVICEQVLEHVTDPCGAVRNLRALTAPSGHLIVSTPFLIKIHELDMFGMLDYWRFTPRGMRILLEGAGLEVADVHSWGNRQVVIGNLGRWSARRAWHTLRNEPDFPVQVWAFAHNPS